MTKLRLHLFMFGIISVFLLSSFSIWRIILDLGASRGQENRIQNIYAARESVYEMIAMIHEIKGVSGSWILLPYNNEENASVWKEIQSNRTFLTEFKWEGAHRDRVNGIVADIDSLLQIHQAIVISNLQTVEDYEIPTKRFLAEDGYDQIQSKAAVISNELFELHDELSVELKEAKERKIVRSTRGTIILIILEILMFLAGLIGLIILVTSPAWKSRKLTP
jgi:hypothetical protein